MAYLHFRSMHIREGWLLQRQRITLCGLDGSTFKMPMTASVGRRHRAPCIQRWKCFRNLIVKPLIFNAAYAAIYSPIYCDNESRC